MIEADRIRLTHMLDASKEAISFTVGKSRFDLESDRKLQMAVTREIEIIGEAAGKVSQATREAYPTIPWINISRMRNHLIHVYFDVDLDILWDTLERNLPALVGQLETILSGK